MFVQDDIPKKTRFIENSVVVNNMRKRETNPQEGFCIGNIKAKEKITIKFKVLVLPQCGEYEGDEIIKNYSSIEYEHLYNIEKPKNRINISSNEVDTLVKNMVFNQITVDNEIYVCNFVEDVVNTKITVEIIDIKIINSPINNNIEGLCIKPKENTCLALVVGTIKYHITYKDLSRRNNKSYKNITREYCVEDIFGFSCCLVVPVGITYGDKYDINFIIEDSITTITNTNTLYLSTNIWL